MAEGVRILNSRWTCAHGGFQDYFMVFLRLLHSLTRSDVNCLRRMTFHPSVRFRLLRSFAIFFEGKLARDWHAEDLFLVRSPLEDRPEMVGGRTIGFLSRMDVKAHRDGRRRVPEPRLDRLDVLPGMDERGGACVPPGVAGRQTLPPWRDA